MSAKDKIRELISLEIITLKDDGTGEDILKQYSNCEVKTKLIEDLGQSYMIRVVTGNPETIKSLEPEMIPEEDRFEIMESVQEVLKDCGVPVYRSEFDENNIQNIANLKQQQMSNAIKTEMFNGLKSLKDKNITELEINKISDKVKVVDQVGEEIGEALIKD